MKEFVKKIKFYILKWSNIQPIRKSYNNAMKYNLRRQSIKSA